MTLVADPSTGAVASVVRVDPAEDLFPPGPCARTLTTYSVFGVKLETVALCAVPLQESTPPTTKVNPVVGPLDARDPTTQEHARLLEALEQESSVGVPGGGTVTTGTVIVPHVLAPHDS